MYLSFLEGDGIVAFQFAELKIKEANQECQRGSADRAQNVLTNQTFLMSAPCLFSLSLFTVKPKVTTRTHTNTSASLNTES